MNLMHCLTVTNVSPIVCVSGTANYRNLQKRMSELR